MVDLNYYLVLSAMLFGLGALTFVTRRNSIIMFMGVELMLNAANLVFVACARMHRPVDGTVLSLMVIAVAAAEVAVGLAILLALFRLRRTVHADDVRELRA